MCASPKVPVSFSLCHRPGWTVGSALSMETCSCCGSFGSTTTDMPQFKNQMSMRSSVAFRKHGDALPLWTSHLIPKKWCNDTLPVSHSHSLSATYVASYTYRFYMERDIAQKKLILICGAKEFSRKDFLFPSRSVHYPHSIAQIKYTYLIKPLAQQGNSLWIIN